MNGRIRNGLLIGCLALLCLPAGAQQMIHHSLTDQPPRPLPRKMVAIPADILVREVSAGGVLERVPKWTEEASSNCTRAIREIAAERSDFELLAQPELSEEEREVLERYLATYLVVGSTAHGLTVIDDPAWAHKRKHFDYTLGTGLAFLREKTGADAAILMVGDDVVSTGERKTLAVVGALFGVAVPLGRSILAAGVVDLATGDILWMNYSASRQYDLKDYASVRKMFDEMFRAYPGLDGKR
ncbi:MAG: hypothetical protein OHK0026_08240 [Rhodocyclaceae bacterium]